MIKRELFRLVTTSDTKRCTSCEEYERLAAKKESLIAKKKCDQICKKSIIKQISLLRTSIRPPKLAVSCYVSRRPGFFIINGFFINFLITLMSFTVYSINNKESQYRLQSTFLLLLSAISLKWTIINRALPSVNYSTLLDFYQILNILFICLKAAWHAFDSVILYTYHLDYFSLEFFIIIFILKHIFFFVWFYCVNSKKRQLKKEERLYFAKNKEHFIRE